MKPVYAVVMVWPNGHRGYHSVWSTKELAERQAAIHNGKWRQEYSVEEKTDYKKGSHWYNGSCVKFDDSVGYMVLEGQGRVYQD